MTLARCAAAVALCALGLIALAACSSSKKADPGATQTAAQATVTGAIPPLPTIGDPDSIALVGQHGTLFDYNISLPEDWKPGDSANGVEVFDVPNPVGTDPTTGKTLKAGYVSVECDPPNAPPNGSDYSSLSLARYNAAATNAGTANGGPQLGHADESSIQSVQVGSLAGATYLSTLTIPPLTGRVEHLYVATPQCAWHVALSIFSPGDEGPYFTLFDRIVQTFRPQGAA